MTTAAEIGDAMHFSTLPASVASAERFVILAFCSLLVLMLTAFEVLFAINKSSSRTGAWMVRFMVHDQQDDTRFFLGFEGAHLHCDRIHVLWKFAGLFKGRSRQTHEPGGTDRYGGAGRGFMIYC